MHIFKHLFAHKLAVFLVFALLCCQAACDLALPKYTSEIVDVGIQQSGIEHVTCEVMTSGTYDRLLSMLPADEAEIIKGSYYKDGSLYRLNDTGRSKIDQLDRIMAKPLIAIHSAEASNAGDSSDPLTKLDEAASDNLAHQKAIAATKAEYLAADYDFSGMQASYLIRIGAIMAGIAALGTIISILAGLVSAVTGARIGRDLRKRLFERVVSFSEREIGKFSAASLITRGTNDIQLIQTTSIMLLRMVLYAPILAIGGIIMVMATGPSLGWIIVVAVVLVSAVILVLFKFTLPKFKVMQKLIDRVNLVAREMLTGMPVVRAFDRQQYEEKRFEVASQNLMETQLYTNRAMSFMIPTMMLVMNAASVAIVWFGSLGVQNGELQTGDLIAFITYSMVIILGFLMIGLIAIIVPRANVASERIEEVLSCEPSITDSKPGSAFNHSSASPEEEGARIEFKDVSFCYDEDGECEDVLRHISFVAEPGKTLAIIGPTGSGKSTILKLIERFYDVTDGEILLDGVDIRDIPQSDLRSQFGYVPQKAFLFSGTIGSNVAYSDEGMDEDRVAEAIEIAQASKIVEQKDEGLNSEISQGGTNVSGGQRQRFAIARALAVNARAFLFDDSFSALDYKTDAALRRALSQKLGNKTCIVVAQRIATVMSADSIIVLDEGRIVGKGTHETLLSECPEYREIALSQLSASELSFGGDAA